MNIKTTHCDLPHHPLAFAFFQYSTLKNQEESGKRNQTSPVGSPTSGNISDSSLSKEQDRFLPIANVSRIMKKALPANAKISKEAKETVQECVSEFISFITGEASDKCQREKRKTINGDDLLWAMTTLGFENYVGPLKVYLNNFRETEGEKGNSMAKQEDQCPITEASDNGFNNGGFYTVGGLTSNYSAVNVDQNANDNMARNLSYRVEW
ncbi:putative transcription factor Hap3/NF-YB family [Lupinus albus]|uniref:Putative transcription factor Hap3/NF-YB family n=1 Tax=Lupinus albus TaxID=3870 RepID=A0A6A4Q8L7_LUPAL|nr:putative transcription factor Hap3/NF-YB family [Lupinus albus]